MNMNNFTFKNSSIFIMLIAISIVSAQNTLGKINVSKNNFVTNDGRTIIFRGLNTSDPDKLEAQNHWNKAYFEEIKNWGANLVRFPVHPTAWEKRGKENYLKLLDDGIKWAGELGIYVIIDWHSIGNLRTEMYQSDNYDTTKKQTFDFWRTIGKKYGNNTTVAFYELFNEPTDYNNELGTITWEEWKELNKEMIIIIRANGGKGIPLVAGFNWAYDLTPVRENPLEIEGIAYVSHPYPQKRDKPWEEKWTNDWGFVKEKYPLILTEIGFCGPNDVGAHIPVISDESYGDAITKYADENEISYMIWVFDPEWAPRLFDDWNYTPSRHGKYFKKKLQSYKY
jgi:aryl-phospho-beta-D-glucosidase BglC (GH1 family)